MAESVKLAGDAVGRVVSLTASVTRIPVALLQQFALILLILSIGMALIVSRALIIDVSPFLAKHAVFIATFFNTIFTMILDVITVIIDIVVVFVRFIDFIRDHVPGCHKVAHPPQYKKLGIYTPLSAEEVRRFFSDLPGRCHDYTNVPYILSVSTKQQTNDLLCPIVRASYPVDWMWDTTNALFGWAIVDATPQGVHMLDGSEPGNCRSHLHKPDWDCVGLGMGYIVVDVILPLLLLIVIWPFLITPFLKLVFGVSIDAVEFVLLWIRTKKNK